MLFVCCCKGLALYLSLIYPDDLLLRSSTFSIFCFVPVDACNPTDGIEIYWLLGRGQEELESASPFHISMSFIQDTNISVDWDGR